MGQAVGKLLETDCWFGLKFPKFIAKEKPSIIFLSMIIAIFNVEAGFLCLYYGQKNYARQEKSIGRYNK